MNVTVTKDSCIGCSLCASNCPETFEMRDGVAVVKSRPATPEQESGVRRMVQDCPVGAILIEE